MCHELSCLIGAPLAILGCVFLSRLLACNCVDVRLEHFVPTSFPKPSVATLQPQASGVRCAELHAPQCFAAPPCVPPDEVWRLGLVRFLCPQCEQRGPPHATIAPQLRPPTRGGPQLPTRPSPDVSCSARSTPNLDDRTSATSPSGGSCIPVWFASHASPGPYNVWHRLPMAKPGRLCSGGLGWYDIHAARGTAAYSKMCSPCISTAAPNTRNIPDAGVCAMVRRTTLSAGTTAPGLLPPPYPNPSTLWKPQLEPGESPRGVDQRAGHELQSLKALCQNRVPSAQQTGSKTCPFPLLCHIRRCATRCGARASSSTHRKTNGLEEPPWQGPTPCRTGVVRHPAC